MNVAGVGPDAPTVTNASGARQSEVPVAFGLAFPWLGAIAVARVVKGGLTKYGRDNWRGLTAEDHIEHAMMHLAAWFAGDRTDDHLSHAGCRLLFALDMQEDPERSRRLFESRPGDPPLP